MISSINSYNTGFTGKTRFAQKAARKVVSVEKAPLKGISKTPIRLANEEENIGNIPALSTISTFATSLFKTWMSIL